MSRRRLDKELVRRGLCATPEDAEALVRSRKVQINGSIALNPAAMVDPGATIVIRSTQPASRAGRKLLLFIEHARVPVAGRNCLDVGIAHGGFTEVLLDAGAGHVTGVDVGYGQVPPGLRTDPRVTIHERTNIRHVGDLERTPFDLIVIDVSFIGLSGLTSKISELLAPDGDVIALVKPQFELPRELIPPGGIVRDPASWRKALVDVALAFGEVGLNLEVVRPSEVRGLKGNREFFVWAKRGRPDQRAATSIIEHALTELAESEI